MKFQIFKDIYKRLCNLKKEKKSRWWSAINNTFLLLFTMQMFPHCFIVPRFWIFRGFLKFTWIYFLIQAVIKAFVYLHKHLNIFHVSNIQLHRHEWKFGKREIVFHTLEFSRRPQELLSLNINTDTRQVSINYEVWSICSEMG